jgi:hypothetical protein
MTVETEDKLADARNQAKAQFESIKEMVEALKLANEGEIEADIESAEQTIHEDALSVEVRCDWYTVASSTHEEGGTPAEYRILLCTGNPAVQIVGRLSEHCEPETAELQCQDWFQPWTSVYIKGAEDAEEIMLAYARCFYYGE